MRDEIQELGLRPVEYRQAGVRLGQFARARRDGIFQMVFLSLQLPVKPVQPQMSVHPRVNFFAFEWLRDVVHPAGSEGLHLALGLVHGTKENHRDCGQRWMLLEESAGFVAVQFRHVDVEQNQNRRIPNGGRQCQPTSWKGAHHDSPCCLSMSSSSFRFSG